MSARRRALGAFLASSALFGGADAFAYCRTHTCDITREQCEVNNESCIVSGLPLSWPSSCVGFTVQENGSRRHGISAEQFERVIDTAFATWLGADCGNGVRPSVDIQGFGPVACDAAEYNQDHGNANIFMFVDEDWPPNDSGHALALTTLWFNPETGSIYDVDVEVNGTTSSITTTRVQDGVDLASILTHEIGHFLGLSHSANPAAVMRPYYEPKKDNLRVLHADDIAGICSIYTPDREIPSNSCTPRHGFSSSCGSDVEGGCSVAGAVGAARGGGIWLTLLLGSALVAWRRSKAVRARA